MESDIKVDDTQAAEVGVFSHDGREYVSGGFSVDVERGRIVAYVTERKPGSYIDGPAPARYTLTPWQGGHLADLKRTDRHEWSRVRRDGRVVSNGPTGFYGVRLQCFRTVTPIVGYHWYGRGLGAGRLLRLRRGRKAGK